MGRTIIVWNWQLKSIEYVRLNGINGIGNELTWQSKLTRIGIK